VLTLTQFGHTNKNGQIESFLKELGPN